jgi:3-deoxy-7-phosphoheptulonate synthase
VHVALCEAALRRAGLPENIMVDCSHGNTDKDPELQPLVARNVASQILEGNRSIMGLMLESNIHAGTQPIPKDLTQLRYGVSVTDPCIDWETTAELLTDLRGRLVDELPRRGPTAA